MAPTTSCPSAPILKTLARKHMDSPTAIMSRGATLTPTSAQPWRSLMGSRKKTSRLATGSLPTAMNRMLPHKAVRITAIKGDIQAITLDGCARRSSTSMPGLHVPQTAHPATNQIQRRLARGQRRGHPAFGHDHKAVGNFKQLVKLFGNHQDCATCVAQRQQLATDLCGSTHIDAPRRLGDQQDPRLTRDFPPDDVLLQIATGQTGRGRLRTMRTDLETVDDAPCERSQYGAPDKAAPDRVRILMGQKH